MNSSKQVKSYIYFTSSIIKSIFKRIRGQRKQNMIYYAFMVYVS